MCATVRTVGFTGSRTGMSRAQQEALRSHLEQIPPCDFHHGDCVGADESAAIMAKRLGFALVSHPPIIATFRAFVSSRVVLDPKPYLVRNRDIVDSCDRLLAAPNTREEKARSGTWSTIRYARRCKRALFIFWPDGSCSKESR